MTVHLYIQFIGRFIQGTATKKSTWIDRHFPKNRRIGLQQIGEKVFVTRGKVWACFDIAIQILFTESLQHIDTAVDEKQFNRRGNIRLA